MRSRCQDSQKQHRLHHVDDVPVGNGRSRTFVLVAVKDRKTRAMQRLCDCVHNVLDFCAAVPGPGLSDALAFARLWSCEEGQREPSS